MQFDDVKVGKLAYAQCWIKLCMFDEKYITSSNYYELEPDDVTLILRAQQHGSALVYVLSKWGTGFVDHGALVYC